MANETPLQEIMHASARALIERQPEGSEARSLLTRAYIVAERLHGTQQRRSGEAYIEHPIAVASLLTDLRMDVHTIAAGLLHDVLEDTDITEAELGELFPQPIPQLVQGVTKIAKVTFDTRREQQIENLRKIILAMARDVRVIIVKLCDRLHNMRTLEPLGADKRREIARESLDIYAPLANRLGIVSIKTELEDLAFFWLHPADYREISLGLAHKRVERDSFIQKTVEEIRSYLASCGYKKLEISGRSKHYYSIYRKMKQQGLSLDEIHDLYAIRIVCQSEEQCYTLLGLVHAEWQPVPGRIKDYIGTPKPNNYRSLHTTVIGLEGQPTEIQIRTQEMHAQAEFGIAAHWGYKEGHKVVEDDDRLKWLNTLREWISDPRDPESFLEQLKDDVFSDLVLCFTPAGDVIELPHNATPIDFAYAIHSKVGDRCIGARINGRMATLRSTLNHGDRVEIQTSSSGHPSRDWLDVVVTGRARQKIKHWLKSKEMNDWLAAGRAALVRLLRERNIELSKGELDNHLATLLEPFKIKTLDDLLCEIGFGTISAQAAVARMNPEWARTRMPTKRVRKSAARKKEDMVLFDGMSGDGMPVRMAECCTPQIGDVIWGYVTRGRGITIHKDACPNLRRLKTSERESGRVLHAWWNPEDLAAAPTIFLRLESRDREGLLNDVTGTMTRNHLFILTSSTRSDQDKKTAVMRFEVRPSDASHLMRILEDLRAIPGVLKVERRGSMQD